jgi:hypothetical protein
MLADNQKREQGVKVHLDFTPIPDVAVEVFGTTGAIVFGVVWRYSQRGWSRWCDGTEESIALAAEIPLATVRDALAALHEAGWIITAPRQDGRIVYQEAGVWPGPQITEEEVSGALI